MLLTKLHIPSACQNIIHRPELFEKLNRRLSRKLILISAPAGFCKTTVVSDWIVQDKIPAAWLSLDNNDNDPVDFLSYIISGIQSINSAFGKGALNLLKSPNGPSQESVTSLLINEIPNISQNFLLVLDDFLFWKETVLCRVLKYYNMKNLISLMFVNTLVAVMALGQNLTQTVRGTILDADSRLPLIRATVMIVGSNPAIGALTDFEGNFKFEKVPIGRIALRTSYLGYETKVIPDIVINSGKESVLDITMQ